jgi:hypothetical protein
LLVTPALIQITIAVVLVACLGKGVVLGAARLNGEESRSLALAH